MTDTTTTDIPATTAPTGRRRSPKATPGQVMELARTLPPARDVLRRACDDATPGQLGFLAGLSGDGERQQGRIQTRPPAPAGRLPAIQDTRRIRPGAWPRSPPTGDANSSPASSSWTRPRTSCSTATSDAARRTWPSRSGGPACRRMIPAGFFTASSLVMRLRKAKHDNRLDTELKTIGKAELPVIDELGYLPIDIEGARLLFQVIADSYETRSVVFTSNLESGRWGDVFGDGDMAAAVIDRIVHHGRIVRFHGESYRNTHSLMKQPNNTNRKPDSPNRPE